jgi:hypothetical protein
MTRKKLIEDIRRNPHRFYRAPADVLRDRRFGDEDKLEILRAWQIESLLPEIPVMIAELETRCAHGHAAQ